MADSIDFSKLDPLIREYLGDIRETLKKAQIEAKQAVLERDTLKKQLDELTKAKEQPTPDARTLSKADYEKLLQEKRQAMRLQEYDQKLKAKFGDALKDVRGMNKEEYANWKMRVSGRKAW